MIGCSIQYISLLILFSSAFLPIFMQDKLFLGPHSALDLAKMDSPFHPKHESERWKVGAESMPSTCVNVKRQAPLAPPPKAFRPGRKIILAVLRKLCVAPDREPDVTETAQAHEANGRPPVRQEKCGARLQARDSRQVSRSARRGGTSSPPGRAGAPRRRRHRQ